MDETTCVYCGYKPSDPCLVPPPANDDAAWEELAEEHADDCEWILTRAHRRPLPVE